MHPKHYETLFLFGNGASLMAEEEVDVSEASGEEAIKEEAAGGEEEGGGEKEIDGKILYSVPKYKYFSQNSSLILSSFL